MKNSDATILNIELLPGNTAPRYTENDVELTVDKAVITEQGMQSGLPLIDIVLTDANGKKYYTALSGRIVQTLGKAIDGVNVRNHGTPNPD